MVTKCICKTFTINWTTDWQLEDFFFFFLYLHVQLLNIVTLLIWLSILYCNCSRIKVIVHTFSASENMLLYVYLQTGKFEVKSFVQYNQIWISVVQLEVSVGPVTRMFTCMKASYRNDVILLENLILFQFQQNLSDKGCSTSLNRQCGRHYLYLVVQCACV